MRRRRTSTERSSYLKREDVRRSQRLNRPSQACLSSWMQALQGNVRRSGAVSVRERLVAAPGKTTKGKGRGLGG
jgi:hypothetical protein